MTQLEMTVAGSSAQVAHEAAFGATIELSIANTAGIDYLTWAVFGVSHSGFTALTITVTGKFTATVTLPADTLSHDVAFLVSVTANGGRDSSGRVSTQLVSTRVVGTKAYGVVVPFCTNETFERSAVVGFVADLNTIAGNSGAVSVLSSAGASLGMATDVQVSPGITINAGVLHLWHGGETTADVALSTNDSTSLLEYPFPGLNPSSHYNCTFGFRVIMWNPANAAQSGSIDGYVDLYLSTDTESAVMVALQTDVVIDATRMNSALAGATADLALASEGTTVEISATRPAGVACLCSCAWWVTQLKEMSVVS